MLMQDARPEIWDESGDQGVKKHGLFNAMSVDIEDWFQVGAFESVIDRSDWDGLELRAQRNGHAVLDMFDEASVKATFFTLGWIAERCPDLMKRVAGEGHEIASHGYDHARVFTLSAAEFAEDIRKTREILEDISGQKVTGYRAPSFSIDQRTPWAHEVLAAHGYSYSSSVAPISHDHYGWAGSPRFAWKPVSGSDLVELPVTTVKAFGKRLAAGGGGFFRLLPYMLYKQAIQRMHKQDGRGAIFYFHPWEIDPDQPRVDNAPVKSKLRHYTNLSVMQPKLERALSEFRWGRMDELAEIEAELAK